MGDIADLIRQWRELENRATSDEEFIEFALATIPRLIDEIERLEGQLEAYEDDDT